MDRRQQVIEAFFGNESTVSTPIPGGEMIRLAELFEPLPGSRTGKVRCTVCGAVGYPSEPGEFRHSWQRAHRRGHAPCPRCGKMLTLLLNGQPRVHGRCPNG